LGVFIYY